MPLPQAAMSSQGQAQQGRAPVPMGQGQSQGQSQWPSDPSEMLGYYRSLLAQYQSMQAEIEEATGGQKLQWQNGQIVGKGKFTPAEADRLAQMQLQMAELQEEKVSIERMIPSIMKMRASQLQSVQGGMSPTQARMNQQRDIGNLGQQMGQMGGMGAPGGMQQSPMGRQMLETEYGPVSEDQWNQYRMRQMGMPQANPMDERAMALREQQFGYGQQQDAYGQRMERQSYADAMKQQLFNNDMSRQRLQAGIAGDVAGLNQRSWSQGMPWAVPGMTEYMPGFEQGGLAQQIGGRMGLDVTAYPVAQWNAPDPRAIYAQYMQQMQQQPAPAPQGGVMLPMVMGGAR